MSDQPKPATGEWTAELVQKMFGWKYKKGAEVVANAHNAALAVAMQEFDEEVAREQDRTEDLNRQLAAKDFEILCEQKNHKQELANQLTAAELKLAAEREYGSCSKMNHPEFVELEQLYRENNQDHYKQVGDLRKQLAASVDYWQDVATQEWHKGFTASHDEHQKQLAAEQARCYNDGWVEGRKSMEQQLAAERELRQASVELVNELSARCVTLVDALKKIMHMDHPDYRHGTAGEYHDVASAALEKMKHRAMAEVTVETGVI